jgi:hypothetical protein
VQRKQYAKLTTYVSIKRAAGVKHSTLPRHLSELNEEELPELQSDSDGMGRDDI